MSHIRHVWNFGTPKQLLPKKDERLDQFPDYRSIICLSRHKREFLSAFLELSSVVEKSVKSPHQHLNTAVSIEFLPRSTVYILGWTPWNLSCLVFIFDNTRLSYWHRNKIGRIDFFCCCCFLALLIFCPVGCLSKTEQAIIKGRKQQKKINSPNFILLSIGKSGVIKFEFQTT